MENRQLNRPSIFTQVQFCCHLTFLSQLLLPFLFTFILILSFGLQSFGQAVELPFHSGEKLEYKVSYNWEFVWVDAGKVEFLVGTSDIDELPHWHFKGSGKSLTAYDWFFKVRDTFESKADLSTFIPSWYLRKSREGDYRANNKLEFFPEQGIIVSQTENSNKPFSVDTLKYQKGVFDLQTAVYYARTLNFSEMNPGELIPILVIIDGVVYDLHGKYHGKENVENYDGKIYHCYRFSATLVDGTIFTAGAEANIWVTADKNKIPVLVEADILVGSVKAYLVDTENLKFPVEALID